jgi:Fe2+ or Zn2+ uptake regulation protein
MAQSDYSMFHEGKKTLVTAQHLVKKLESLGIEMNLATVYIAFSNFEYMNSDYNKVSLQ